MAVESKQNKLIIKGDEARKKLLEGAEAVYDAVASTYGPKGNNVMLEKPFGRPNTTRDGVTVARDVYFSDRAKNMGAQAVLEAAETTNRIAGDGTSATSIMSFALMRFGQDAISNGSHPMSVASQLRSDSQLLLDALDKLARPTKKAQLKHVASVSCGDPALGELIASTVSTVGQDGGIITEKAYSDDVEREFVNGYYLQHGFEALQVARHELSKAFVVCSNQRLSTASDAVKLLTAIFELLNIDPRQPSREIPRLLFVGAFEDNCYNTINENINRGIIDGITIKTPSSFGAMAKHVVEDIALYTGAKVITDGSDFESLDMTYIGQAVRVVATKSDVTIFSEDRTEDLDKRVADIKDELATEVSDAVVEKLKDRVAKLEGKIALFRIGGTTESEKEEKEYRVEDAIQATRAALAHGVVAGGGTTLLQLSKTPGLSDTYIVALQSVFEQLLANAAMDVDKLSMAALQAPYGMGYNIREGDELVDLFKTGILDPKLVVEQVIKNATSVAANALTCNALVIYDDYKPTND
jgi:chaperonin GroEL